MPGRIPAHAGAARSRRFRFALAALCCLGLVACASAPPQWSRRAPPHSASTPAPARHIRRASHPYCVHGYGCYRVLRDVRGYRASGIASWYGLGATGKPTASGVPYDPHAMRVASKTLPFGTWIRIRNRRNGREAVAMVNDRGPFHRGRIIDGTIAVARRLGYYRYGTAPVTISVISRSRLSHAQLAAARANQRRAVANARAHHGHILAEAGSVAVHGVVDVTATGVEVGVGLVTGTLGVGLHVLGSLFHLVW